MGKGPVGWHILETPELFRTMGRQRERGGELRDEAGELGEGLGALQWSLDFTL